MSMRAVLRATVGLVLSVVVLSVAGRAGAGGNPDYTAAPPDAVVTTPRPHAPVPDPGRTRRAPANPAARDTPARTTRLTNLERKAARQRASQRASQQVETVVVDRVGRSRMPVTGSDVTVIALAGLALMIAGGALLALRRRFGAASPFA